MSRIIKVLEESTCKKNVPIKYQCIDQSLRNSKSHSMEFWVSTIAPKWTRNYLTPYLYVA